MELKPTVLLLPPPRPDGWGRRGADAAAGKGVNSGNENSIDESAAGETASDAPARATSESTAESERPAAGGGSDSGGSAGNSPNQSEDRPARPSAPFLAQMIAQEHMTSGLHIEPWTAAITAYHRAFSASPVLGWH